MPSGPLHLCLREYHRLGCTHQNSLQLNTVILQGKERDYYFPLSNKNVVLQLKPAIIMAYFSWNTGGWGNGSALLWQEYIVHTESNESFWALLKNFMLSYLPSKSFVLKEKPMQSILINKCPHILFIWCTITFLVIWGTVHWMNE